MTATTATKRSILSPRRYGLPALILLLAGAGVAALWLTPDLERGTQAPNTLIIAAAAAVLLVAWTVLVSGFRWYVRIAVVLLAVGLAWLLMLCIVFDGDMSPHLRWPGRRHDEVIEAHRRGQASGAPVDVELSDRPTDWPEFRGVHRDGVAVRGPKLSRDWNAKPPRLVWKQPCGAGYSSFAVSGNLLVTLEQRRDNEAVVGYEAGTGRELWKHEYPARFMESLGGLGPRSTPTISEGEVFSLGATGQLVCLEAKTGKLKWTVNILDGGQNLMWGMAGSPLVVGRRVIVSPGSQGRDAEDRAVLALDRETHQTVWAAPGQKGGYSSPMLVTIDRVQQVIVFDGKQVGGFDLDKGTPLWSFPWDQTMQDINVAQPIVWDDGRVFISSGYTVGCAMLRVSHPAEGWRVDPVWQKPNKPLRCKFSGPVEFNGDLYGLDEGVLACISAKDGVLHWRGRRYGHGQLLRWEDLLIILAENGELALVRATPEAFHELGRVKAIEAERTWNVPALVDGRIFVRNDREMACFDLRE